MADTKEKLTGKPSLKHRMAERFIAPLAAAAASAAAGYALKKGPQLFEDKILPWLRNATDGAGDAARELPSRAKSMASDAGDVAERLTDRARSVAAGARGDEGSGPNDQARTAVSSDELERRRKAREKGRTQRRRSRKS
jgi:hypothetical protein